MTNRKRIAARAGTRRPHPVIIGHTHDDDCTLDADGTRTACEAAHGEPCRLERERPASPKKRPSAARWRRP